MKRYEFAYLAMLCNFANGNILHKPNVVNWNDNFLSTSYFVIGVVFLFNFLWFYNKGE